jgi:hypothetical protein
MNGLPSTSGKRDYFGAARLITGLSFSIWVEKLVPQQNAVTFVSLFVL